MSHHRHRSRQKARLELSREAAAAYLRGLADQLEAGRLEPPGGSGLELGDATVRVKQSIDEKRGGCRLQVRLRLEGDAPTEAHTSLPRYASLKKRMKATLRELRRAVERGEPVLELAGAFEADADQMVRFPGKGDADYPTFIAAVAELRNAADSGSVDALRAALDEIAGRRRRCHRRYR